MKLDHLIAEYAILKRSMGQRFVTQSQILSRFSRQAGNPDIKEINANTIQEFLTGSGPLTAYWHGKLSVLRGFYRFAVARGHVESAPLPSVTPKVPEPTLPHIYSVRELRCLLAATKHVESSRSPLQATVFRTLLLTLYGAALRIGEALSLTLADVDVDEALITIRDSKFYKSRLVPTGPRLTETLATYARERRRLGCPDGDQSPFFANRYGDRWRGRWYPEKLFRRVRSSAGVHRRDGAQQPPRLHDLRHTAAVHRVVAWYRQGEDVQLLLPYLATYLGHVDVTSTQRYLSMTAELLTEANHRFERYAGLEVYDE